MNIPGGVDEYPECYECFGMWICQEFQLDEEECPDLFDNCEFPGYGLRCEEAEQWCEQTVENSALLSECIGVLGGQEGKSRSE